MAVRALPRTQAHAPLRGAKLPPVVLALTLVAPALDLFTVVQPGVPLAGPGLVASLVSCAALLLMLGRYLNASWLAAASLAAVASVAMRLVGADVSPFLSLLAVIGLGVGGAFASPERSSEAGLS
jgi:hypothetical protein